MTTFLKRFRNDQGGATAIEYGLMAAILGTGVVLSANYVKTEFQILVPGKTCVFEEPDENDPNAERRCVEIPGWKLP